MERMRGYPKRSWYLHMTHYVDDQGRGTVPFTPAVQVYYAFEEALNELLEEGVANRMQRYKLTAARIRERLGQLGVKTLLPPECQSNTITAFRLPPGITYAALHDQLKARGYVIYAGQGQLEEKIFRIANMGALTENRTSRAFSRPSSRCLRALSCIHESGHPGRGSRQAPLAGHTA